MSKTKWIIAVVVVVLLVAGYLMWKQKKMDQTAAMQAAAVAKAMPAATTTTSYSMYAQDTAALDAQIGVNTTAISGLTKTLTAATVTAAAGQSTAVLTLAGKLATKLQTGIVGAGAMQKSLQTTFSDMSRNVANANSQIAAATKNVATVPVTTASLQQAKSQLVAAQNYIQTVRADIQIILQGLAKH